MAETTRNCDCPPGHVFRCEHIDGKVLMLIDLGKEFAFQYHIPRYCLALRSEGDAWQNSNCICPDSMLDTMRTKVTANVAFDAALTELKAVAIG